jgi:AraC family transcriptional regulator
MHQLQYDQKKPRVPGRTIDERVVGDKESSALKVNALLRSSSSRLASSERSGWNSIQIEHHNACPYEKTSSTSPYHLIALFKDHISQGESAVVPGHFVPFSFFPGAMNLYSQGPLPACRSFNDMTMIVCALDPKFMYEVGKELERPPITDFRRKTNLRDRSLEGLVMLLSAETQFGGSSGKLYRDHLAHALALRFLWLVGGTRDANPLQLRTWPHRALQRVLDKMEAEATSDLDLNTLAAESGYSRSHFLRIFQTGVGYTPHQWLMRLRVERAKKMLREDSDSIVDIANACGFSSHAHLSRTFQQIVGMAPSKYRRTCGFFI